MELICAKFDQATTTSPPLHREKRKYNTHFKLVNAVKYKQQQNSKLQFTIYLHLSSPALVYMIAHKLVNAINRNIV